MLTAAGNRSCFVLVFSLYENLDDQVKLIT